MGMIPVFNQTGVDQHFGHVKIRNNEWGNLPYSTAKHLAITDGYRVEDKALIQDYPYINEGILSLGWSSPLHYADGYGSIAQEISSKFLDLGIDLSIYPRDYDPGDVRFGGYDIDEWHDKAFVPINIVNKLKKQSSQIPFYGINMTWPRDVHRHRFPRGIGFTMFETTAPPKEWTVCMNKCKRIIVPCKQNKEAFQIQGCTVPIHVVPLGINPDKWEYCERKHNGDFIFLMAAGITMRKNPLAAVEAFIAAFDGIYDVRLILKTRGMEASPGFRDWQKYLPLDNRVQVICEESTPAQMLNWMHVADAFVFPSHSEGFGLTPLQAMCTGLPVIVSDNSGMSEYCDDRYNYPVECYEVKVPHVSQGGFPPDWGDVGNWWNPSFESLVERYREVYNNHNKAKIKGKKAAKWVRDNWTIEHVCNKIMQVVKEDAERDGIF